MRKILVKKGRGRRGNRRFPCRLIDKDAYAVLTLMKMLTLSQYGILSRSHILSVLYDSEMRESYQDQMLKEMFNWSSPSIIRWVEYMNLMCEETMHRLNEEESEKQSHDENIEVYDNMHIYSKNLYHYLPEIVKGKYYTIEELIKNYY